jgi:hypothetical protein
MKNRINHFLIIFIYAVACFDLIGCATQKISEKDHGGIPSQTGQWETKAYIKNLKENKNHNLDIDIFAIKNNKARFEITALLGIQVASLVVSPQDVSYIIYSEKAFYHGKNSGRFLEKALGLPLNIMSLSNIAFEQPIRGSGWKCTEVSSGLIDKCENLSHGYSVIWKDRSEGQKVVLISAPQFEMVWKFKSLRTEVQFKNETFNLKQPEGFKAVQIN